MLVSCFFLSACLPCLHGQLVAEKRLIDSSFRNRFFDPFSFETEPLSRSFFLLSLLGGCAWSVIESESGPLRTPFFVLLFHSFFDFIASDACPCRSNSNIDRLRLWRFSLEKERRNRGVGMSDDVSRVENLSQCERDCSRFLFTFWTGSNSAYLDRPSGGSLRRPVV